jgi:hypothetical protein
VIDSRLDSRAFPAARDCVSRVYAITRSQARAHGGGADPRARLRAPVSRPRASRGVLRTTWSHIWPLRPTSEPEQIAPDSVAAGRVAEVSVAIQEQLLATLLAKVVFELAAASGAGNEVQISTAGRRTLVRQIKFSHSGISTVWPASLCQQSLKN